MKDSERPAPDEGLPDQSFARASAAAGSSRGQRASPASPPSSRPAATPTTTAMPPAPRRPTSAGRAADLVAPRRPRRRRRPRRPPPPETTEAPVESSTPTATIEPLKQGLAPGMYGGPVGFDGAERYQYPLDSEEGRAIDGLRKLRADGKAPDKLIVQVLDFAQPQFEKGFPQGAQSHLELFKEETGIKIEFVVTSPADEYPENLRNASTQNGSFDLVTSAIEEVGDFAEAGLLLPLDEYVAKYQPQWADPEWGYLGGEPTVALFNQYKGSTYTRRVRQRHAAVLLPRRTCSRTPTRWRRSRTSTAAR